MLTPLTTLYETTVSTVQAKIGSLLDSVHLDRVRNWFQPTSVVEGADDVTAANAAVPPLVTVAESGTVYSWISTGFLVLRIFLYIFPIFFAVLVANHLIFMPWQVRLFAFIFVYIYMGIYPVFTVGVPVYYILNALFSAYHNFNLPSTLTPVEMLARKKQYYPDIRGFLPLSTWKTDSLWAFETLLFPFKYRAIRSPALYTNNNPTQVEVEYNNSKIALELYCEQLIPGYSKLIKTDVGKALKLAYDMHMSTLNYSPVKITAKPVVAPVASTSPPAAPAPVAPVAPVASTSPPAAAPSPALSPTRLLAPTAPPAL
jgi:hypothetical protein